jgi:hypothetical protein
MVAGLLYVIGLIAVLATLVTVGLGAPPLIQTFMTEIQGAGADYLGAVATLFRAINWALTPFVGGLIVMGIGRIIFLLGAINRALRGTP